MKIIDTIFFDVGGVCLTNGWDEYSRKKASKHFNYNFDEAEKRHEKIFKEFEKNLITRNDYLDEVVFVKEQKFSREDFISFMKEQSKPVLKTLQILLKLKNKGIYFLATINNESYELNNYRLKTFGLNKFFNAFFSSAYLKMRKPEPEIFITALNILGKEPLECLFIDDRKENIEAAQKIGIQTIHLTNVEKLEKKLIEKNIKF